MSLPEGGESLQPAVLRESQVFGLATTGMLEAAHDYVRLERVHRPRRRGQRIAAEVDGTDATYSCGATVVSGGENLVRVQAACECPSRREYCKHVLALLLLWCESPEVFAPVDVWEGDLRSRSPDELTDLLGAAAMGADALELLRDAAVVLDWLAEPPGHCLQEWDRFRRWAETCGQWPAAALQLGARIAGPPGSPGGRPTPGGAPPALAARQLAWWLTRMLPVLPAPTVLVWVEHLMARLEALPQEPPPPELGVWLARVAAALPPQHDPERGWLARFAANAPTLSPVFEAELERGRWEAELTLRLAVAPAVPAADDASAGSRHRAALAALAAARSGR